MSLVSDAFLSLWSGIGSAVYDLAIANGPIYARFSEANHRGVREVDVVFGRQEVEKAMAAARVVLERGEAALAAIDAELAPEPKQVVEAAAPALLRCVPRHAPVKTEGASGVAVPVSVAAE